MNSNNEYIFRINAIILSEANTFDVSSFHCYQQIVILTQTFIIFLDKNKRNVHSNTTYVHIYVYTSIPYYELSTE